MWALTAQKLIWESATKAYDNKVQKGINLKKK